MLSVAPAFSCSSPSASRAFWSLVWWTQVPAQVCITYELLLITPESMNQPLLCAPSARNISSFHYRHLLPPSRSLILSTMRAGLCAQNTPATLPPQGFMPGVSSAGNSGPTDIHMAKFLLPFSFCSNCQKSPAWGPMQHWSPPHPWSPSTFFLASYPKYLPLPNILYNLFI